MLVSSNRKMLETLDTILTSLAPYTTVFRGKKSNVFVAFNMAMKTALLKLYSQLELVYSN